MYAHEHRVAARILDLIALLLPPCPPQIIGEGIGAISSAVTRSQSSAFLLLNIVLLLCVAFVGLLIPVSAHPRYFTGWVSGGEGSKVGLPRTVCCAAELLWLVPDGRNECVGCSPPALWPWLRCLLLAPGRKKLCDVSWPAAFAG